MDISGGQKKTHRTLEMLLDLKLSIQLIKYFTRVLLKVSLATTESFIITRLLY